MLSSCKFLGLWHFIFSKTICSNRGAKIDISYSFISCITYIISKYSSTLTRLFKSSMLYPILKTTDLN